MSDKNQDNFDIHKTEFENPACHGLHVTLIELMSLSLFTVDPLFYTSICKSIMNLFLNP